MDLKSPQEIPSLVYLASEATWSPAETEAPKVTEAMTSCPLLMAGAAKLLTESQTLCHHFIHRTAAVLFWFLCLLTQLLTLHDRWGPDLVALEITPFFCITEGHLCCLPLLQDCTWLDRKERRDNLASQAAAGAMPPRMQTPPLTSTCTGASIPECQR